MTSRRWLMARVLAATLSFAAAHPAGAQTAAGDPPGRVGRLAQLTGTVSFHTSDESQWEAATLNYPITSGNSLWTEPQAHAAIDVGGSRIYLDSSTELDVGTLNDQSFVASLPQGAVFVRVSNVSSDGTFEIDTPRGAVTLNQPGHYEIIAGDATHPTTVSAVDGTAQVAGPGINLDVPAGQSAFLNGQNPVTATRGAAQQDDFGRYVYGLEQPYASPGPTQQYVSPGITGYQDLNQYGQWQQTPSYGPVWVPQVAAGWAPYRFGHWAYIWPWGWTWVDDAPWGFAPFHYGRWALIDADTWAWVPGVVVAQPVYAPALVSFFGDFGGVSAGFGFGFGPAVGWVPLGPEEVWVPPFHCSPRFIRNVNITNVNVTEIVNVTNNTTIINNTVVNKFANFRGATVVPTSAMANSQAVGRAFRQVPANGWQEKLGRLTARSSVTPLQPTLRTAGMTPRTARQLGQPLPANGQLPGRRVMPGPAVSANNIGGAKLGNGHRLPTFAAVPQTGGAARSGAMAGQNAVSSAARSFGGFAQQNQKQLKGAAPGPTFLPRSGQTGAGGAMAFRGNGAMQNRNQGWSFLPPLKGQPGAAGQARLPGAGTGQQPQIYRNQGGLSTQQIYRGQGGQGQSGNQRWAKLPPLQTQPQARGNGQFGGYPNGASMQPQIYRNSNGAGQGNLQRGNRNTAPTYLPPQGQPQGWRYQPQYGAQRGTYAAQPPQPFYRNLQNGQRGTYAAQPPQPFYRNLQNGQGGRYLPEQRSYTRQQQMPGGFSVPQRPQRPASPNGEPPYLYQPPKHQGGGG
jgi:hypothetical protein